MAKTGPRRNQWTGPVRPRTPPAEKHPLDPAERPAKRQSFDQ